MGNHPAGIDLFNPRTNNFRQFHPPADLSIGFINDVIMDHTGLFWIGTDNGLITFDPASLSYSRLNLGEQEPDGPDGNAVNVVLEDQNNNIWVCTGRYDENEKGFLHRLDRESESNICPGVAMISGGE